MKVLAIIPAKMDSKRLPGKNMKQINGLSLVEHSIVYAKNSSYGVDVIVSSESTEIKKITDKYDIIFHNRSKNMCGDTEVVDVYIEILKNQEKTYDYIVGLQPDHPDREHSLDDCLEYMISNNYDDLITIEENYKRSGSVRIFKFDHLINSNVSKRIGCLKDTATDIHYIEDLNNAKLKMKK